MNASAALRWTNYGVGTPPVLSSAPMCIRSDKRSLTCTDVHGPGFVGPLAVQAGPCRGSVSVMKKLINSVDNVVTDALRGMAAAHPHEL